MDDRSATRLEPGRFPSQERMNMRNKHITLFVIGILLSASVQAGNVTMYHEFTGAENGMTRSPASADAYCSYQPPAVLPYQDLGTFTVSQTGQYRVADFQIGWLTGPKTRSIDTALLIYEGSFNSSAPAQNRVAVFDYGEYNHVNGQPWVGLDSTKNYQAVLQKICDADPGVGGFILRGPGEIAGVGFPTPAGFYGDFSQVSNSNVADFGELGFHKYDQPYTYTAKSGGFHWFFDMSVGVGGGEVQVRVYSEPFDKSDTAANLLAASDWWLMRVYLEEGQQVHIVTLDKRDSESAYQTIIHAPGELLGINPYFTGTWFDPTRAGQGVLMDMDERGEGDEDNVLFLALFSFTSTPATLQAANANKPQSVGSTDQRWLTALGSFSGSSTEAALTFENTTGGRFNSAEPPAEQDFPYGTGRLVAHDCKHIDIEYDLPDVQGVFTLTRGLLGFTNECAEEVPVAAPEPQN